MHALKAEQVDEALLRAGIRAADQSLGIGRQLTFERPSRTLVLHLSANDTLDHRLGLISHVLGLHDDWLLLARYGSPSDLGLLPVPQTGAISFTGSERPLLAHYLCTRPQTIGLVSADLYVLSPHGRTLVTWDHHTLDEGLQVNLGSAEDAGRLLLTLNRYGAELELFAQ